MANESKKRILILITNSFAAINIIHSGLMKALAEKYEISILSTLISQHEAEQIKRHYNIHIRLLNLTIPAESAALRFLRQFEKWSFFKFFQIETQKIKESTRQNIGKNLMRPIVFLARVSGLDRVILVCLRKIILRATRYSSHLTKLDNYHFAGVISTSPLDYRENKIVNFLKARGIGSMAMIISWDNLTSKGIINADHDYILVWNQFMADEYQRFYSIFKPQKSKICITGIPRFDIYFRDKCEKSANDFRSRFKIDPSDKVILFATSADKHFPNQTLILHDLTEYTRRRPNVKVIVRCHPADQFERYRPFNFERSVIIWQPENLRSSSAPIFSQWMPRLDFLETLSSMMKACDVCVQAASTIRLDATACNKPVISIAYDGPGLLPYSQSVKRLYDYSHQIPLNRLKIDQMVYNKSQLFSSLDKILNENCRIDYKYLARPFIHYADSKSVDSVMQNVHEWLS